MIYHVIFNPNNGNLYGLTTFNNVSFPDEFVIEPRSGELPRTIDLWDNTLRDFVSEIPVADPKRIVSKLEFLNSFTMVERIGIRSRAQTDPVVTDILQFLEMAEFVNKDDLNIINSIQYLASIGVIDNSRISVILGG